MNTNKAPWMMLFAALIFALFSCVEALPGICPNYYGPYAPNPIGQSEYCENMMTPGAYNLRFAHGPESNWDWQYWNQLDMKPNTRYVLTYDSSGDISIDESEDSSLTGFTVICGRNNGPDELVFCLEPIVNTNQAEECATCDTDQISRLTD
jgi:hypothetical protein